MRRVVLAAVLILPLALAQDESPGQLVYVGNGFDEPRTFVEGRTFTVTDDRHFHEIWWSGNATAGRVEFLVLETTDGVTGATAFRRELAAPADEQNEDPLPVRNGTYRLELRFFEFTGYADSSVWDVIASQAGEGTVDPGDGQDTPTPPLDPASPRPAAFAWVTPTLVVQTLGVAATITLGSYGIITVRRRQRRLAEHLERIEAAFESHKGEHAACRHELLALREEFRKQLREQDIEERQYLLLEGRINDYLGRLPPNT